MVEKTCKFCGKKFQGKRVTAEFCSDNHRVQWNNKQKGKPPAKGSLADQLNNLKTDTEKPPPNLSFQDQLLRKKLGIK